MITSATEILGCSRNHSVAAARIHRDPCCLNSVTQFVISSFSHSTQIAAGHLSEWLSAWQKQIKAALIFAEGVDTVKFVLICVSYGSVGLTPEIYSEIKLLHYTRHIVLYRLPRMK